MARSPFPFHGIFSSLGQGADEPAAQPAPLSLAGNAGSIQGAAAGQGATVGQVAVDIYEQDNYIIIKAPIAGVRLCDLDIEVSDNVVTIRGMRRQTDPIQDDQYYLQECFWGEFSRSVTLPVTVDPKKIRATFNKECILKILVPKEERVKIVRISEV
jgi:HSP20 family protein